MLLNIVCNAVTTYSTRHARSPRCLRNPSRLRLLRRLIVTTNSRLVTAALITLICTGPAQHSDAQGVTAFVVQQNAVVGQLANFKNRQTADDLLRRARQVLDEGNVDLAEWYVTSAERLDVEYESLFSRFSDTPQKVRQAITAKRMTMQQAGFTPQRSERPQHAVGAF